MNRSDWRCVSTLWEKWTSKESIAVTVIVGARPPSEEDGGDKVYTRDQGEEHIHGEYKWTGDISAEEGTNQPSIEWSCSTEQISLESLDCCNSKNICVNTWTQGQHYWIAKDPQLT